MDPNYIPFARSESIYYETAWDDETSVTTEDLTLAVPARDLPSGWTRRLQGPWVIYRGSEPLPASGWKVHVALTPLRSLDMVPTVIRACGELGVSCKSLRSQKLVSLTQHKYAELTASGKVVTAYPATEESAQQVVLRLRELLCDEPGARIPGDIWVQGCPIGLRYGAFTGVWTTDATGRTVPGRLEGEVVLPDVRGAKGAATAPPTPAWLDGLVDSGLAADVLPITEAKVLHRSNAGGVYQATWADGRIVVIKEARHHTGYDAGGADAVARLRHEWRALKRLSGSGTAPEPVDYLRLRNSDMLVMEHIDGLPLSTLLATRHHLVVPGATPSDADDYRRDSARALAAVHRTVERLHARGVVHLDLHPANVMVTSPGAVLIDFESCAVDGVAVANGVATPAAWAGSDTSPAADLHALDVLARTMDQPMVAATARFHPPEPPTPPTGGSDKVLPEPRVDQLINGILASATPHRSDRLFPGDIRQFTTPGAAVGLMHGAAGVLLSLHNAGVAIDGVWLTWLRERLGSVARGLVDGIDGVAFALAGLGQTELLASVSGELTEPPEFLTEHPGWGSGRTGLAVAASVAATALDSAALMDTALQHCAAIRRELDRERPLPGYRPGLLTGWSGICLGLLAVAERVDDPSTSGRLREDANRAILRELSAVHRMGTGILVRDGRRALPYLGIGSAALGLALDGISPYSGEDHEDLIHGVCESLRVPIVAGAGLLMGRAGMALTLRRLRPTDPALEIHCRELGWNVIPSGTTASPAQSVLGDQNLRCSTDLATGSAGVLPLVTRLQDSIRDPLSVLLGLPAGSADTLTPA